MSVNPLRRFVMNKKNMTEASVMNKNHNCVLSHKKRNELGTTIQSFFVPLPNSK